MASLQCVWWKIPGPFVLFLGGTSGSGRPAGTKKDRQTASSWIGLAAHWDGFLPYERG